MSDGSSLAQVHGACVPHALVRASGSPAPGVDVENCKNECNQLRLCPKIS
jgi:5-hydroxyisourate hydrolase-like protein (transthyretin family)